MNDNTENTNESTEAQESSESLVVTSKTKKFIKEFGFNTSSNFCDLVSDDIKKALDEAIKHATKAGRKTVMGKDFNLYVDDPKVDVILVVASKVKAYVKSNSGLSTSSQAMEQLTIRVHQIVYQAMEKAKKDKRKTVMDRDFSTPMMIVSAPSKEA